MIFLTFACGMIFSNVNAGLFGLDPTRTAYTDFRPIDGSDRDNSIEVIRNLQTARQFEEMAKILFEGADSLSFCQGIKSKVGDHWLQTVTYSQRSIEIQAEPFSWTVQVYDFKRPKIWDFKKHKQWSKGSTLKYWMVFKIIID